MVDLGLDSLITCRPANLIHEIARITTPQLQLQRFLNQGDEVSYQSGICLNFMVPRNSAKDLAELIVVDRTNADLCLDAPQEGRVQQLGRIEIGCEHNQHFEWDFDLAATRQSEELDSTIERHDPAVQQLVGTNALAAKVVDDQHAVVGFHLHRADVELVDRVKLQV